MWRPPDETRPKCYWTAHRWELVGYTVMTLPQQGGTLYAISECPTCGRFKTDKMLQEKSDA